MTDKKMSDELVLIDLDASYGEFIHNVNTIQVFHY